MVASRIYTVLDFTSLILLQLDPSPQTMALIVVPSPSRLESVHTLPYRKKKAQDPTNP